MKMSVIHDVGCHALVDWTPYFVCDRLSDSFLKPLSKSLCDASLYVLFVAAAFSYFGGFRVSVSCTVVLWACFGNR